MEMRPGNCMTKSKDRIYRIPPDARASTLQRTIFGKDAAPFQGGKEEKGPSWTVGK